MLKNIETIKINPHEIAKASDMQFGFKSVLEHFAVYTTNFFMHHVPSSFIGSFDGNTVFKKSEQKPLKDCIIGGGFTIIDSKTLRPLPIAAYSAKGGVYITNGIDYENRPLDITLADEFYKENHCRIESIFIGNAEVPEEKLGDDEQYLKNKDPDWDDYAAEWRASHKLSANSEDTIFSEFKKRQMQAVRFYVLAGADVQLDEEQNARAANTHGIPEWENRVKIAEVMVRSQMINGEFHILPFREGDIRGVTARRYWEGVDDASSDDNRKAAEQVDSKWVSCVPNIPNDTYIHQGMSVAELTEARRLAAVRTAEKKAARAEHYNYRWTEEVTRTYTLGTVAEISERVYKILNTDGSIKEEVVLHKNILLRPDQKESLRSDLIPVGMPDYNTGTQDIPLPYSKKIVSHENIKSGLLALAETFYATDDKITNHINDTEPHGSTSSATANRIALRDSNGRLQVANPNKNDGKGVVNVDFLNRIWSPDFVIKVLQSKLITTLEQFEDWVANGDKENYSYIYIKIKDGGIDLNNGIDFSKVKPKEVYYLNNNRIRININPRTFHLSSEENQKLKSGVSHAIFPLKNIDVIITEGFQGCIGFTNCYDIDNCTANITSGLRVYGFFYCTTVKNSSAVVTGKNGANADAFNRCMVTGCTAKAYGGNGVTGYPGGNGSEGLVSDSGGPGGPGGSGGDAKTFINCILNGTENTEYAKGGNGGEGGHGGQGYYASGGSGGVGGTGGDAYVIHKSNGVAGKGGIGGQNGSRYNHKYINVTTRASNGKNGTVYII